MTFSNRIVWRMELDVVAARCRTALKAQGCKCVANVSASVLTLDIAFVTPAGAKLLVRCSNGDLDQEIAELVRVLAQCTFEHITLIHSRSHEQQNTAPCELLAPHEVEAAAPKLARVARRVS